MGKLYKPFSLNDFTSHGMTISFYSPRLQVLFLLLLSTFLLAACDEPPQLSPTAILETRVIEPTSTSVPPTRKPAPTITPQPTSSLGVKESDLNGITLRLWHPWSDGTGQALHDSLSEFNSSNKYGITVEAISQGSFNSLYEMVDAEGGTGLPNIVLGTNYQIQSWVSAGKPVAEVNKYLNDPEWGFTQDELADFHEIFLQQDIKGGKRFGLPAVRTAQVIYYNTSWAEELGFTKPPETPQEFKEQVCTAAQSVPTDGDVPDAGSGGWLIDTTPSAILSWLYAFNSQVLLPDGAGYRFNTPQTEAAILFLKELLDEGCAYEVLESPAEVEFANRRALSIISSLSDLSYLQKEFTLAGNPDRWTVLGFPSAGGDAVISVYGSSYAIFAGTPNENLAAWLVLKWLLSPAQGARLIEAHGTFPVRASMMDYLGDYTRDNPQWAAAQELLPQAQAEPGLASWESVRWILGDVGIQIFRYYFTPDRIPATLELMDETAEELHSLSD